MEIAVFIQRLQEERAEVALQIFSNKANSKSNNDKKNQMTRIMEERFQMTDRALEEIPTWPIVRPD